MSRILVCRDNEELLLKKSNAFQYKEVDLSSLACGTTFSMKGLEDKLLGEKVEEDDGEPVYTLVTKEFGLYAKSNGVDAKVKISFCDNGLMLVDVLEGALLFKPEEEILLVSRGVSSLPSINLSNILWVNADKLLSFAQYWGDFKSRYTQDFEYVFVLGGETKSGLDSFSIRCINDETIDISGGAIAVLEAQMKVKEEAKEAERSFMSLLQQSSSSSYEFDDDDEDDEDDEDYEDDEDDDYYWDGSNY